MKAALLVAVAATLSLTMPGGAQQRGARGEPSQGPRSTAAPADTAAVRSLHVQGNVWMINGGSVNAAVQVGDDGVLIVDTLNEPLAEALLAEVRRLAGGKPIRYIINTHAHGDHTGGNLVIGKAGKSIVGGNFAPQVGQDAANAAQIFAHENVQLRMSRAVAGQPALPVAAWPTDTFIEPQRDLYFNGEAVQMLYQPNAHSDGDILVYFRKSDVLVAGDLFITTTFPIVRMAEDGSLAGIIAAANTMLRITVPKDKQEGGTYVIPGHGRLSDEADVVEYRDMLTILRDRFADAAKKKMTLEQVKAARLVRDYEGRYGSAQGAWTTDAFVEIAYRSVNR